MTPIKQVRLNIGDPEKANINTFVIEGVDVTSYQLDNENLVAVTSVRLSDVLLDPLTDYVIDKEKGIISFVVDVDIDQQVETIYTYASLSDEEIQAALDMFDANVDLATIKCLDWILASSAKLYNYKSADEDMNMGTIYKNLSDFKKQLEDKVRAGGNGSRIMQLKKKGLQKPSIDFSTYDAPW